ncbi:MAG: OmpA family protein, partial [Myxococcales bacterium]|nr:OmpA family protein [Myxococcales bacterium]
GCPDPDNDKDGICDPWVAEKGLQKKYAHICKGSDKCPNDPEDKDGFEDEDGCPDPDNDKDGICDPWVADKGLQSKYAKICSGRDNCPDVKGPKENNGCPLVKLTASKIEILQKVFFKTASAKILEKSYPLLAKVAEVLKQNQDIKLVLVEGHTDSRGKRRYNLRLSKARAKSVMLHLIKKHGISKKRLKSKGYGPDKPLVKGDNEAAWEKNRRVEFTILKRDKK